eukprot:scaffold6857_cov125-Isochrysis_galbana.AAC.8
MLTLPLTIFRSRASSCSWATRSTKHGILRARRTWQVALSVPTTSTLAARDRRLPIHCRIMTSCRLLASILSVVRITSCSRVATASAATSTPATDENWPVGPSHSASVRPTASMSAEWARSSKECRA